MNDEFAARIVGLFAAAWPWAEWPQTTVELWLTELARLDADPSVVAARRCVCDLERPPSLAAFLDRYHDERRRSAAPALALPAPPAETWLSGREHIRRHRELWREATRPGEHNHHGPHPCPRCGGAKPTAS